VAWPCAPVSAELVVNSMKQKIRAWIDQRTGLETALRSFLYEDIPASSGWHQVLGSVALFLFLIQAFTGILLAFNYAPTPGDAYDSLRYIVTEIPAGRLLHGLHHWGASMMIVVVVLHMTQVFLYGAYKKPREATWMVGVVLLLVTLGFGLTGYLLPWDNRAYWGTVVTTQIASKAPFLGPYIDRLLGGGGVGVVTFARFFGLHVLILPALLTFLIVLHVYLVRKHGVASAPGDSGPPKKFFPEQVLKDTVAIFIAFAILYGMTLLVQVPLERLADPTDTTYIPRPDWYFLFLFQFLKFFKGSLEPIGSVVFPTLGVLALFIIPFVDRRKVMKLTQRTVAFAGVVLAGTAWTALTVAAVMSTPKPPSVQARNLPPAGEWNQLAPTELAGLGYFRDQKCSACHNLAEGPPKIGPNLAGVGEKKDAAWMISHFKDPSGLVPGTAMPPIQLTNDQLNALAAFLLKLTPESATRLADTPNVAVRGAQIFVERGCGGCHMVNGVGAKFGPALNGVAERHTKEWVEKHFENPSALTPGSAMPAFKFSPEDMNAIVSYLFSPPG
jgi:quinol-cytochrome oxidoreductase complex cytochrome b subunit/cytochrome c2